MTLILTIPEIRDKLLIKYPQLNKLIAVDSVTTATFDLFIEDAINILSIDEIKWGNLYLSGILLLSSHYIVRGTAGESNSGIIAESGDDANRTKYHTSSVQALGQLSTTKYGNEFEIMQKKVLQNYSTSNEYFGLPFIV